jgi:hypothetical protein
MRFGGGEQVGFAVTDDKGYVYICYVPVNEHGKYARNRRGSVTRLPLEPQSYYHSLNKVTMPVARSCMEKSDATALPTARLW